MKSVKSSADRLSTQNAVKESTSPKKHDLHYEFTYCSTNLSGNFVLQASSELHTWNLKLIFQKVSQRQCKMVTWGAGYSTLTPQSKESVQETPNLLEDYNNGVKWASSELFCPGMEACTLHCSLPYITGSSRAWDLAVFAYSQPQLQLQYLYPRCFLMSTFIYCVETR